MANRTFSTPLEYEKTSVTIYANISIGATGAPTLNKLNRNTDGSFSAAGANGISGVKSITRSSAGKYVVTLQDPFIAVLAFWAGFSSNAAAPAAPVATMNSTGTNVRSVTSPQITFTCYAGATATDPASGEVMSLEITLAQSTAY